MMDTLFSLDPEPCGAKHCHQTGVTNVDVPWHYIRFVLLCPEHTQAVARGEQIALKHQPKLAPIPFGDAA